MPAVEWGRHTRVVLDVGCGVASFGGYLLDKNVITMSLAPKDEHEAQIQFALERGIPSFLAVIGTQKLVFPDNAFDLIHCARCRVHWDADGGKPLLELNRVLRPGGLFVWSATPVYRHDDPDEATWKAMVGLTEAMCWETVVKSTDADGIGAVIYKKPLSNSCYKQRNSNNPPLCTSNDTSQMPWYVPLTNCIPPLKEDDRAKWPNLWPERLFTKSLNLPETAKMVGIEQFNVDTKYWQDLISSTYLNDFVLDWSSIHNVMDMSAHFGSFAAALIHRPLWVMNVVPIDELDTLQLIYNRGLIGVYHDWCESFNTYPRTYDLLHSSFHLQNHLKRCDAVDIAAEIDRILRPGRWFLLQDSKEIIRKFNPIFRSLHYETVIVKQKFLVAKKSFWRPK